MPSINRLLVTAGASGLVMGITLWIIGAVSLTVIPALPAATPLATFIIGFGGAVSTVIARDTKKAGTSINRKLVMAGSSGITLGTIMWLMGAVALTIIPALPAILPIATFLIGFGGAVATMLDEDIEEAISKEESKTG